VLLDRRIDNVVPRWDGETVLATDLAGSAGLRTDLGAEVVDLLDDQLLHAFDTVLFLKAEVEFGIANRLVRGVVPDLKVRVRQRLLAADAFRGVETQHLREKVDCQGVGVREQG